MKRILSALLCAAFISSSLVSFSNAAPKSKITASAGLEKYGDFLEKRLGENLPDSVYLGLPDENIDMSDFADDGYVTRASCGELVIYGKTEEGIDRGVRDYAKNGNPEAYSKTYNEGYRVKRLTVFGRDISDFTVLIPENADECLNFAAGELCAYIEKTCGARLEISTGSTLSPAILLQIGELETYGDEAFSIDVKEDRLTITGGRYRGCMYGVYDLLEQDIGWRFYADPYSNAKDYLYCAEHIDITDKADRFEESTFKMRCVSGMYAYNQNTNDLVVKSKGNKWWTSDAKYGTYGLIDVANHGLQGGYYVFDDFDWYNGDSGRQPCFSSEEHIEAIVEQAITKTEKKIASGQRIGIELTTVDVAHYDTTDFCKCNDCMKIMRQEQATSGAVVRMTNRVAEAVEELYPELYVLMFAYAGTDKPPIKTRPRDNVRVSFCFYIGDPGFYCGNHVITDPLCKINSEYCDQFDGWINISKHVDVWYYAFNCYGMAIQSPFYFSLYDDINYLRSKGVESILVESIGHVSDGARLTNLSSHLFERLLWDSSLTKDEYFELIREWFNLNYGDAGDFMYECLIMNEYSADEVGCWCSFHARNQEKISTGYVKRNYKTMLELFDEAYLLADTSEQEHFIEIFSSGYLYMIAGCLYEDKYINGTEEERTWYLELCTEMQRIFKDNDILFFYNLIEKGMIPDEMDFSVNPFEWVDFHGVRVNQE